MRDYIMEFITISNNQELLLMVYYVNGSVEKSGNGSKESPFKKIQMAADVAVAGDEIIVAPGAS